MTYKSHVLDRKIYDYAVMHSVFEPEPLKALRELTLSLPNGEMMSAPEQGQLLSFLIKLIDAKFVIEIGTFTGYATLWMALALPGQGQIISCDLNAKVTNIGMNFWRQANVTDRIKLFIQDAGLLLDNILSENQSEKFDLAYIDADKKNNKQYYEKLLQLIRPGGLIVIDNVLWKGQVVNLECQDSKTQSIREFNDFVQKDKRVDSSMLILGDGMTIARKR